MQQAFYSTSLMRRKPLVGSDLFTYTSRRRRSLSSRASSSSPPHKHAVRILRLHLTNEQQALHLHLTNAPQAFRREKALGLPSQTRNKNPSPPLHERSASLSSRANSSPPHRRVTRTLRLHPTNERQALHLHLHLITPPSAVAVTSQRA
jgi:hypothetical protein